MAAAMALPCRVVLVEPRDARNVGMVARACANFGVADLVVVHVEKFSAALGRAGRSEAKARELGVDGADGAAAPAECRLNISAWKGCERLATDEGTDVLKAARLCCSLDTALGGARRAIAFSGRQGDNFRRPTVTLRALAQEVNAALREVVGGVGTSPVTALVFGSEDTGLPIEALLRCDGICQLRTSGLMSLNLSHAVAVTLARLLDDADDDAASAVQPCQPPVAEVAAATAPVDRDMATDTTEAAVMPTEPELAGADAPRAEPADAPGLGAAAWAELAGADAPRTEPADALEAPGLWTAAWAELCRERLEALGYPAQRELWSGRGRRSNKLTFRLFKIVAGCARTLQRARPTSEESDWWMKLVRTLTSPPSLAATGTEPDRRLTADRQVALPAEVIDGVDHKTKRDGQVALPAEVIDGIAHKTKRDGQVALPAEAPVGEGTQCGAGDVSGSPTKRGRLDDASATS
eukprot:NODE_3462_length_2032_cov_3.976378.p1 GENE.NODE_3462_length_2032_cov_3.976378~~NODE_3462_length_2032_cov_3.976378.p1  ORF type:complete len:467 (+),score=144.43 NODE_3462_length_2032_cov_3.976378:68-1468(+)